MKSTIALCAWVLAGTGAAETILGAYMFHRHGDRTPKALAPTNLTALGYEQVYSSGSYYRSRYLTGNSTIRGINQGLVKLSQIAATAPVDNVLQSSAMGFLQGLYPPVQTVQTLANGQKVSAPMDGYQLIPVNTVTTGAGSEDSGWLQDASTCYNAQKSSNSFFTSQEYLNLSSSTKDFYSSVVPSINNVINGSLVNFKNAYIVYDIINVAEIHNTSIPNSAALTNSTLLQLRTLADQHEWGLAYNASDNMRAVAGMQLAGEILKYFNSSISSQGSNKLGIQFGAYGTFMSFFGLAGLPHDSVDFTGIVDYASSMVFELFTTADISAGFPNSTDALQVRFLFHNGTASNSSQPTVYPLFGGSEMSLSWNEFQGNMSQFAITTTQQWCTKCGNSTGLCASSDGNSNGNGGNGGTNVQSNKSGNGISPAIGGVIGAFVTLAIVLGSLAAFMLLGGFRLVSKKRMAGASGGAAPVGEVKA